MVQNIFFIIIFKFCEKYLYAKKGPEFGNKVSSNLDIKDNNNSLNWVQSRTD